MFPYPSGAGLHVGHPLGYIATDVFARYHRMPGNNVLHCLGYDAFGLPAEQYAVQTGQHPRKTTEDNMVVMRRQLRRLGLGHDERRSDRDDRPGLLPVDAVDLHCRSTTPGTTRRRCGRTADGRARPIAELVEAYASGRRPLPAALDGRPWAELAEAEQEPRRSTTDRLAYTSEAPVNWCPGLGTVLSNEEVTADGRSERGNFPVFKRNLRQWMMRITAYADRLADDLDRLDWPEPVKPCSATGSAAVQRRARSPSRWHGDGRLGIEVFTTRPDTVFGATFMVLAPEHPLVDEIVPRQWPEGTKPGVDRRRSRPRGRGRGIPAGGVAQERGGAADRGHATRPACSPARTRRTP